MDWPMGYDGADVRVWAESVASSYSWPLLAWAVGAALLFLLVVMITGMPVRRRFWCEQAGREVDVEFQENGSPLLRRFVAVVSCTAFEPSAHVRCNRAFLARDISSLELRRPA